MVVLDSGTALASHVLDTLTFLDISQTLTLKDKYQDTCHLPFRLLYVRRTRFAIGHLRLTASTDENYSTKSTFVNNLLSRPDDGMGVANYFRICFFPHVLPPSLIILLSVLIPGHVLYRFSQHSPDLPQIRSNPQRFKSRLDFIPYSLKIDSK